MAAIGAVTRQQKVVRTFVGMGQGQKGIAISAPSKTTYVQPTHKTGAAKAKRISAVVAGAYIGAAPFRVSGGHADGRTGFLPTGRLCGSYWLERGDFRQPLGGHIPGSLSAGTLANVMVNGKPPPASGLAAELHGLRAT
jgi:hypothetical protein